MRKGYSTNGGRESGASKARPRHIASVPAASFFLCLLSAMGSGILFGKASISQHGYGTHHSPDPEASRSYGCDVKISCYKVIDITSDGLPESELPAREVLNTVPKGLLSLP
jgi:hypothetical protein